MSTDPFGLRSFDVGVARTRPGVKWQREPHMLASWVADMDFPVAPAITERLRALVDRGVFGYPNWPDGLSPAAHVFAARMESRHGWELDGSRLHELADVVQGVRMAIGMLSLPGDGVALHLPAYHPFLHTMSMMDRRPISLPAAVDAAVEVIARERPAVMILCHPHNPTGRVFTRDELRLLADAAQEYDVWVISDEIHSDLVYAPALHIPFAAVSDTAARRCATVTSASKAFNLAGLRWAVLHAGPDVLDATIREHPSHWFGAPNQFAVEATVAAWEDGDEWLTAVRDVLNENRHVLSELLARHLPGVGYTPPEATYLAWLDCSCLGAGDAPYVLFRSRGVEVSPGPQFGDGGDAYVRLNFATSPAVLASVVAAMGGA